MLTKYKSAWLFTGVLLFFIIAFLIGLMLTENLPIFDSLYMTIISILGIGYGDYIPNSNAGKIVAMILIPITLGLSSYLLTYVASILIEGNLSNKWERKKMNNQIDKMENHYIICGYERVGEQVLKEFLSHQYHIVVIDTDESVASRIPEGVPYIIDDAKQNHVLEKAGIERAKGLIATTSDDSLNLFITLTAKGLNSEVEVIARAEVSETEDKLKRAGADHVVNPSDLGGRRMALSLIKPVSMHYIDSIIHAENRSFQMEDFRVGDQLNANKISELKLREKFDLTLLGLKRDDGEFLNNPDANETLQSTDVLILFGEKEHIDVFTSQNK
ncbi:potassium channel protein [Halobacillus andaensis]|uniref:Potassium channel protein n=1 Tax=Halobacillus andaensis TaxID=1176239 RepID=A0A917B570_HALAA|nr:potassium channel protein [Halobacillus andaensis]MBP2005988.1 voltage-gated potassium channel [Halobacillus andaensis]GGF24494.1 potassium channel protein [Halobacillus andaensis]